jgi:DNA-binding PadR family transcriptional regulator
VAELTTTSYVILGILASRECSAYELAHQLGRGHDQVWPRAERQLYNAPKSLVDAGYARARQEMVGRRGRTVYSITRSGRAALKRWLSTDPQPPALEFEGLVRVLVADQGTIDQLRHNLAVIVEQSRAEEGRWAAAGGAEGDFPERRHLQALANEFLIGHHEHIVRWATWALEETASWSDTRAPEGPDHGPSGA